MLVASGSKPERDARLALLQMSRPQKEVEIVKGLRTQQGQSLRIDAEHFLPFERANFDMLGSQQAVLSFILAQVKQGFKMKRRGGHGWKLPLEVLLVRKKSLRSLSRPQAFESEVDGT